MTSWKSLNIMAIAVCLTVVFKSHVLLAQPAISPDFPPLRVHSLPAFSDKWQSKLDRTDYFSQIESTPLGYLVWSQFPIKVYLEQTANTENTAANRRFQQWTAAGKQAIAEWNTYLPLQEIADRQQADIIILRSQPARKAKLNPETGLFDIPRAVAAQTNYKFYLTEEPAKIAFKMTMEVSSSFTGASLLATMRHELGHALGIWGHSPEPSDALYFSQVSDPPPISARDLNTLKKIYQQPTKLGWKIERSK